MKAVRPKKKTAEPTPRRTSTRQHLKDMRGFAMFGELGSIVLTAIADELSCEHPFDENGKPTEEAIEEALEIAAQSCRQYLDQEHGEWLNVDVFAFGEPSHSRWIKLKKEFASKGGTTRASETPATPT